MSVMASQVKMDEPRAGRDRQVEDFETSKSRREGGIVRRGEGCGDGMCCFFTGKERVERVERESKVEE